ncbi:MAG: tetratricopeptide repeat protein [Sulfurimonas sp.]|jgi:lipopolysaccharide biosynthesis regulator YciM|nr:tetratricopeptide repeat protein [Sulfurimonas sp.]
MNTFFIEFRDPLFGVIVFFVLIFIITFFSYWWGRYKTKEDYRHLDKFLKQFRSAPTQSELSEMMSRGELSEKSWILLASAYYKTGDYEKSIEIYNELLKHSDKANTREIMYLLGKTYYRAGFLERSKQVFLEILKRNPRTPQALRYLFLIYEYTREYERAREVLEPLDELEKDVSMDSSYLKVLSILNDMKKSAEEKSAQLLDIYKQTHQLTYMIFEYLFKVDPKLAWRHFDHSKSDKLIDILWGIQAKDLDLDIITKNGFLRELYTARGDLNLAQRSSIFELDVLIHLHGKANASLSFEYICEECKQAYPFAFHRCSACHGIDTQTVDFTLSKDYRRDFSEENNSFQ